MKKRSLLLLLAIFVNGAFAQNHYCVLFADKHGSRFNPIAYFDAKALERKVVGGIALCDSTDFPVNGHYVAQVGKLVHTVGIVSRWFNCVYVEASFSQMETVKRLPFVRKVVLVNTCSRLARFANDSSAMDSEVINLAKMQLNRMQGTKFIDQGINGKGIRIALFDGGFPEVDTHPAFEHIRKEKRIVKTYDFTKKREFVYAYNSHGLSTFSNIAGIIDGVPLGLATGAEFLLARTEVNTEPFAEEQYWLAAAEWADQNGAHIISSSLGYTADRYFPEQMDGAFSLVVKAANMAASKGMLVVNAMGNDGENRWKVISTPADADSIISVGGIDPESDMHISFSSFGPTKDGRMKPNVCSYGKAAVAAPGHRSEIAYGTSFATPLISGFAACAWQTRPKMSGMALKSEIERSADRYPYYDYAHGFGVPQASYFTDTVTQKKREAYIFKITEDLLEIEYTEPLDSLQLKLAEIEEEGDGDDDLGNNPKHYLYFHIAKPDGKLARYGVVYVHSKRPLDIPLSELPKGYTVRISYQNGFQEWIKN